MRTALIAGRADLLPLVHCVKQTLVSWLVIRDSTARDRVTLLGHVPDPVTKG